MYLVNKLLIKVLPAMLDLSGTNNKLTEAANIVKRVKILILDKFLLLTKAPQISNNIPLINNMFIMFPSTNMYYLTNNQKDSLNFVQTITYEYI